jgi:NADH-quinone oxidoreductase subunit L
MGGLGSKLPAVRNVFIIGAAALAGLPILNGFWSKELVLEAGLEGGPGWVYAIMLFGAGLTALYTFRCVWMVFFAPERSDREFHDAGAAMQVALYPLALGSLTTWLLAGPFSKLLAQTLPLHHIEMETTLELVEKILIAPATWLALGVVVLGLVAWWQRKRLEFFTEALHDVSWMAGESFGFEAINRGIVRVVTESAEDLRSLQTGMLNWNIAAIIVGVIAVILIVALGA